MIAVRLKAGHTSGKREVLWCDWFNSKLPVRWQWLVSKQRYGEFLSQKGAPYHIPGIEILKATFLPTAHWEEALPAVRERFLNCHEHGQTWGGRTSRKGEPWYQEWVSGCRSRSPRRRRVVLGRKAMRSNAKQLAAAQAEPEDTAYPISSVDPIGGIGCDNVVSLWVPRSASVWWCRK